MEIKRIPGATRNLGAPPDWNEEKDGPCASLPIRDEIIDQTLWMLSDHEPTPAELEVLNRGGKIRLFVQGRHHPVIGMSVLEQGTI